MSTTSSTPTRSKPYGRGRPTGRAPAALNSADDGSLFAAILGRNERSNRLRQSPPYVGLLPRGWKNRLVNLSPGDTDGVRGLCLDPHDLAIAKYVARREKDRLFTRELARRGIVERDRLLTLVVKTPVAEDVRERIFTS